MGLKFTEVVGASDVNWALMLVFFMVGLGFELRASHLQIRGSTVSTIPPIHFALVIYLFIYFGGTGVRTQDLMLAGWVLYHLIHSANHVLCWAFLR
jgi:hypothetical protein